MLLNEVDDFFLDGMHMQGLLRSLETIASGVQIVSVRLYEIVCSKFTKEKHSRGNCIHIDFLPPTESKHM